MYPLCFDSFTETSTAAAETQDELWPSLSLEPRPISFHHNARGGSTAHAPSCRSFAERARATAATMLTASALASFTRRYTNDPAKLSIMTAALHAATSVVAFSRAMEETALQFWPFIAPKLRVVPQAVSIPDVPRRDGGTFGFHPKTHIASIELQIEAQGGASTDESRSTAESNGSRSGGGSLGNSAVGNDYTSLDWTRGQYKLIVLPAGLRPVKDVLFAAAAISDWHVRDPSVRLVIFGDAVDQDYAATVKTAVDRLPGVWLVPALPQHEFYAVLQSADLLLNTSESEGMCGSILEAMALGTPVAARNVPGNAAVVTHNETGLLFATADECVVSAAALFADAEQTTAIVGKAAGMVAALHSPAAEQAAYREIVATTLAAAASDRGGETNTDST